MPSPASRCLIDLDTAQLDQIVGVKGQANGGVYQLGVPRRDSISMGSMTLVPANPLGLATAIGFHLNDHPRHLPIPASAEALQVMPAGEDASAPHRSSSGNLYVRNRATTSTCDGGNGNIMCPQELHNGR